MSHHRYTAYISCIFFHGNRLLQQQFLPLYFETRPQLPSVGKCSLCFPVLATPQAIKSHNGYTSSVDSLGSMTFSIDTTKRVLPAPSVSERERASCRRQPEGELLCSFIECALAGFSQWTLSLTGIGEVVSSSVGSTPPADLTVLERSCSPWTLSRSSAK